MIKINSRQAQIITEATKDAAVISRKAGAAIRKSIRDNQAITTQHANWIRHAFSYNAVGGVRVILDVPGATKDEVTAIADLLS